MAVLATNLPNGRKVFFDLSGKPLVGGLVAYYTPATTNPVLTYTDAEQTIPNTNPIILDAAGSCSAFGIGKFREYVTDSVGVVVSDGIVSTIGSAASTPSSETLISLGVSPAMLPIVEAATVAAAEALLTAGSPSSATHLGINPGDQTLTVAPTANAIPTLATLNVQGTTKINSGREFLVNFGLNSNNGVGGTVGDGSRDKVTLYLGLDGQAGTGDIWTLNTCLTMEAGSGNTYNAQGYELDFNNLSANYGDTGTLGTDFTTIASGMSITGSGSHSSTTGLSVNSQGPATTPGAPAGTPTQWNRGITSLGKMKICAYQEWSTAPVGMQFDGAYSIAAINFTSLYGNAGAVAQTALFLKNDQHISWQNNNNQIVITDRVDPQNNRIVGEPSVPGATNAVFMGGPTHPQTTGANLGSTVNRWGDIWATNCRLQRNNVLSWDANPAVLGHAGFIFDYVDDSDNRIVGSAAQTTYIGSTFFAPITPAMDLGTSGNYWGTIWAIGSVQAPSDISLKKNVEPLPDVTDMVMGINPITFEYKDLDGPNPKTHWGFNAAEIEQVFGSNFAGYKERDDGIKTIAKDELIAVLWKMCQELHGRVTVIEEKFVA